MVRAIVLFAVTVLFAAAGCTRPDPAGTWHGTIDAGPAKLRVVFSIIEKDGRLTATLSSPDQGPGEMPVTELELTGDRLRIEVKAIAGRYEGRIDGDRIAGEWTQAGRKFPLELVRNGVATETRRPQEPVPPFPYRIEELTFAGPVGSIAGTLVLPDGTGPFPTVVLVSGSGQQDRDQQIFGHRPFLVLADYLARRGYAVLRCDDRGVGGSTGDPTLATSADFADDTRAALDWLRARVETDPARTGIIGHSEGAIIGAMLAARADGPAFLVMLAGPGVPGNELLPVQGERLMRAGGASEGAIAANRQLQQRLFATVRRIGEPDILVAELQAVFEDEIAVMDPDVRTELLSELSPRAVAAQVQALASPWFRFFLDYDPASDLRRVNVPVLALCGTKDLQTPPDLSLPAITAALEAGRNPDHTVRELTGLNHLFQTAETGSMLEYGRIEETFAPAALEVIGDWLDERVR